MYLEKIELQGFKSFAPKTELEFNGQKIRNSRGITAIVGPNGSGKSNIADAVRWVLGEQSIKTLRGKKSEDVIFSGSDKKARLGFAEVSLFLNNEDGSAPIDYSEITITRRLYRNGESEYLVNKNKARLSDILMLLAKANFGQRTYSVIGQGMVDHFLIATPTERKEFFDEAAGVRQFQIKREQTVNKIKNSRDNLNQAEALISEIEPRLRSLTRQVKRLEKREGLEKELKELQLVYYGNLWKDIMEQYDDFREQFEKAEKKRDEKDQEVRAIQKQLGSLEEEDSRSEVFDSFQKEYEELLEEKNKLREKEIILKNKIDLSRRKSSQEISQMPLDEIISQLDSLDSCQDSLIKRLLDVDSLDVLEKLKKEFSLLKENFSKFINRLKNPASKSEDEVDKELVKELDEVEKSLDEVSKKLEKAQENISDFNKKEEKKKGKFFDLQRDFQEKQMDLNQLNNEVNEVKIELARLETRKENLEAEIRQELGGLEQLKKEKQDSSLDEEETLEKIRKLKYQLDLIGGIDPESVEEYKETKERYDFLKGQVDDLNQAIESLEKVIEDLDETIKKQFDVSFKNINEKFEEYFKMLFGGGKADLIKIMEEKKESDEDDEQENLEEKEDFKKKTSKDIKSSFAGIEIQATPPGKKLKNISMLSGGERAMTSIALICAIISNNPSPFVVLDEVDAALDEANSLKFADILEELAKKTQFIIITHNRATMQKADILYGVTMGEDGISKLLGIKLEEGEKFVNR